MAMGGLEAFLLGAVSGGTQAVEEKVRKDEDYNREMSLEELRHRRAKELANIRHKHNLDYVDAQMKGAARNAETARAAEIARSIALEEWKEKFRLSADATEREVTTRWAEDLVGRFYDPSDPEYGDMVISIVTGKNVRDTSTTASERKPMGDTARNNQHKLAEAAIEDGALALVSSKLRRFANTLQESDPKKYEEFVGTKNVPGVIPTLMNDIGSQGPQAMARMRAALARAETLGFGEADDLIEFLNATSSGATSFINSLRYADEHVPPNLLALQDSYTKWSNLDEEGRKEFNPYTASRPAARNKPVTATPEEEPADTGGGLLDSSATTPLPATVAPAADVADAAPAPGILATEEEVPVEEPVVDAAPAAAAAAPTEPAPIITEAPAGLLYSSDEVSAPVVTVERNGYDHTISTEGYASDGEAIDAWIAGNNEPVKSERASGQFPKLGGEPGAAEAPLLQSTAVNESIPDMPTKAPALDSPEAVTFSSGIATRALAQLQTEGVDPYALKGAAYRRREKVVAIFIDRLIEAGKMSKSNRAAWQSKVTTVLNMMAARQQAGGE